MTSDERRVTSEEVGQTPAGPKLTPAMRQWVEKLERGYTIRPVRVWRKKEGGLTWRPGLFNPEGAFVQKLRLRTAQRLQELGYIGKEKDDDGDLLR